MEMREILNALDRINHSLDERFEKDANLYVPVEEVDKIKIMLHNGQYNQIADKLRLKKFPAESLTNVIIKNAWLIKKSDIHQLNIIFNECDLQYLYQVMLEVFENKLEMQLDFRLKLLKFFLRRADSEICQEILNKDYRFLNNPEMKALCIKQILKGQPILERYKNFTSYVSRSPNLLTEDKIFREIFKAEDFSNEVKDLIFDNDFCKGEKTCNFWVDCLSASNAEYFAVKLKLHCRKNSGDIDKASRPLLYVFNLAKRDANNMPMLAERFAEACAEMDSDRRGKFARNGLNRAGEENQEIFKNVLSRRGIDVTAGGLLDLDGIIEKLNDAKPLTGKFLAYLVVCFNKQYQRNYKETLDQIWDEVDYEAFEKFCISLVKNTWRISALNMKYMLYIINEIIDEEDDEDEYIVRELLNYIADQNIFNSYANMQGIKDIKNFVRDKDFDLFVKLTAT